jgi:hypothetical protein
VAKKPVKKAKAAKVIKLRVPPQKTPIKRAKRKSKLVPQVLVSPSQEIVIEESKYYAMPGDQNFPTGGGFEFPTGYGDNKIVLMVRDPYWLFAYWEAGDWRLNEIKSELGEELYKKCREWLRICNVDNWHSYDVEVGGAAKNWYIRVPNAGASYCVELGLKTPDGRFILIAKSNVVTTPSDKMSDIIDEEWLTLDWDKLYALSGGFGIGKSSQEIRELIKKRFMQESSSGWVSSISSPAKKASR